MNQGIKKYLISANVLQFFLVNLISSLWCKTVCSVGILNLSVCSTRFLAQEFEKNEGRSLPAFCRVPSGWECISGIPLWACWAQYSLPRVFCIVAVLCSGIRRLPPCSASLLPGHTSRGILNGPLRCILPLHQGKKFSKHETLDTKHCAVL